MNLILLFDEDFLEPGTRARLTGRRFTHVQEVHRAALGDELTVGLAGGRIGRGVVTALRESALEMDVAFDREAPAPLPLRLVLALPRPLVLKRVLVAATSMGVKQIVLLNANRVEKSFWTSKALAEQSLREAVILGLEQARDTHLPEIALRRRFKPFVEDELGEFSAGGRKLVAHPGASSPCPVDVREPSTLVIGPEGGFIPYEVETLEAAGCSAIHLGERILRVETALPALIARLYP